MMKTELLYLGRMECCKDYLVRCEDKTEMIKSPVSAVVIRHPELGTILYDTGNTPFFSSVYPEHVLETYPIVEFISIEEGLQSIGLKPSDIDGIILSHLHFDHAGGLAYFKNTKAIRNILVAEAELQNAFLKVMTGNGGAYVKELFDLEGICFRTYQGECRLADDLTVFRQESHTPGCSGLLLRENGKNRIFTSDTIYTEENFKRELPPGGTINATTDEFYSILERIRKMQAAYDAEIVFGHDYDQIRRLAVNV